MNELEVNKKEPCIFSPQIRKKLIGYNIREAAALLGMNYSNLRFRIDRGYLPAPKRGLRRRKYYNAADVETLRHLMTQSARPKNLFTIVDLERQLNIKTHVIKHLISQGMMASPSHQWHTRLYFSTEDLESLKKLLEEEVK